MNKTKKHVTKKHRKKKKKCCGSDKAELIAQAKGWILETEKEKFLRCREEMATATKITQNELPDGRIEIVLFCGGAYFESIKNSFKGDCGAMREWSPRFHISLVRNNP